MISRFGAFAPSLLLPFSLFVETAVAAEPPAVPPVPGAEAALQVLGALLLVLLAVIALAWLLRRLGHASQAAGGLLRVVGALAVGPRERVVVVEVGDTWLVLGVSQGGVSALHSLPRPEGGPPATPVATPRFARLLGAALQRRGTEPPRR